MVPHGVVHRNAARGRIGHLMCCVTINIRTVTCGTPTTILHHSTFTAFHGCIFIYNAFVFFYTEQQEVDDDDDDDNIRRFRSMEYNVVRNHIKMTKFAKVKNIKNTL